MTRRALDSETLAALRRLAMGAVTFALIAAITPAAQSQTFNLLYTFTSDSYGRMPYGPLVQDHHGNLYGTTFEGGILFGTVFELSPRGSGWILNPIYKFNGNITNDGDGPYSGVVFGPDGTFYGTTTRGGGNLSGHCLDGCGVVYNLRPPPSTCRTAVCPWVETVIYHFAGATDADTPGLGNLTFDHAGNMYGTTIKGGAFGAGTVYRLTPSHGGWTESVLYSFSGGNDGGKPESGVTIDQAGNLYGTTYQGGSSRFCGSTGCGTVYELGPSGSGWTETVLYNFQAENDGSGPLAGLVFDQQGNLFGASSTRGPLGGGAAFEMTPANGGWTFNVLYMFGGGGPSRNLTLDGAGNVYGAWVYGNPGGGNGVIFELERANSWAYTGLHNFDNYNDGEYPQGSVLIGADGNLYGTTSQGGTGEIGTVWQIVP